MNIEKAKCISHDEGWIIEEDRPEHHYCRFRRTSGGKPHFMLDIYYSKHNTIALKQSKGNVKYIREFKENNIEEIPMKVV